VAGTVGSASLTSEKEATLTITKDYKVGPKRLTNRCSRRGPRSRSENGSRRVAARAAERRR